MSLMEPLWDPLGCWTKNGRKQDEQAAADNISQNSFCAQFLSTASHLYLTFSPAGVRPCCISFAVPPLNTQRPMPLAHLGKSDNLRCSLRKKKRNVYLISVLSRLGTAQAYLCFHLCHVTESRCGTLWCAQRVSVN